MNGTPRSIANVLAPSGRVVRFAPQDRRMGTGRRNWAQAQELRQPQDGAPETKSRVETISAVRRDAFGLVEPEDARLTGGTRSLMRRLLGLNVLKQNTELKAEPAKQVLPARRPMLTAGPRTQVA